MRAQLRFLSQDLRRYSAYEWLTEPSVWALIIYRVGRGAKGLPRALAVPCTPLYVAAHLVTRILSGVDLPRSAEIGPGLRIYHGGPIVVHPGVAIGAQCDLGHGVTIGRREEDGLPVIGDHVVLSAYAQVLGAIHVGDGTKVGAMSVVIQDLPANVTAAGIPARVLGIRDPAAHP